MWSYVSTDDSGSLMSFTTPSLSDLVKSWNQKAALAHSPDGDARDRKQPSPLRPPPARHQHPRHLLLDRKEQVRNRNKSHVTRCSPETRHGGDISWGVLNIRFLQSWASPCSSRYAWSRAISSPLLPLVASPRASHSCLSSASWSKTETAWNTQRPNICAFNPGHLLSVPVGFHHVLWFKCDRSTTQQQLRVGT